ncbi:winged helix-turn-helix domain-containing protein [Methanotrichaceae archaeon M04Ac]|uniref:Winged helix-turn-helix domain-containing protein n=1 Tax=Candidatus Methanocrinis alkalitolerans TaxID=3033395 RepID=A0ABT5XBW5_9EURY|nr:winged helix-turn-helix domain-containing protein [Candidatus Methanocrinis alkalitolerans]MDF0592138.1 winged helix-turn-helix domain-containing protein [Candidatus Methanocrinis alkalitolerans]
MDLLNRYDLTEEYLKGFTRSKVRTQVILSLLEGEMSASELEKKLGARVTTILHSIKDMMASDLVEKSTQNSYSLTNLGKMQGYRLMDAIDFALVQEQHKKFWLTHDIAGIPSHLLKDIGMLSKSEMIESDPTSILKTTEHFVSGLKRSKMIKGVSPYVIPAYPDTIIEVAKTGARINLILTPKVIKALIKDYAPAFREVKGYDNVVIRSLDRETTIGFTVTDSFLSLGLFRLDGNYDLGSDLICIGDSAVSWGNELFEYYNKMSKPL